MVNLAIKGENVVLEASQYQSLDCNADHKSLLISGGLSGGGLELGRDLGPSVEHLRSGDAGLAAVLGDTGAGYVPEAQIFEHITVTHNGQVQPQLHGVYLDVQVRFEPLFFHYRRTVVNVHAGVILLKV